MLLNLSVLLLAAGRYGRNTQGLMLPPEVLADWSQRDLNTSDDAGLVGQDFRGGDFIDALRNSSSVMAAGATLLRGLQGDVKIPKKTGSSTAAFVSSEGTAVAESEMTIGSCNNVTQNFRLLYRRNKTTFSSVFIRC